MMKKLVIGCIAGSAVLLAVLTVQIAGAAYHQDPTQPPPRAAFDPSQGHNLATRFSQTDARGKWSLTTFDNDYGQRCEGITIPGHGLTVGCIDRASQFADSPVAVHFGASQDPKGDSRRWALEWIWGRANAQVSRIDLQRSDCQIVQLQRDSDGYFMYVFASSDVANNIGPQTLSAYAADGTLLSKRDVSLSAPSAPGNQPVPGAISPVKEPC